MSLPRPPVPAAVIGYALVIPVLFGAATEILMTPTQQDAAGGLYFGFGLLLDYASVVLVFLSGALWGFAARAGTNLLRMQVLAVLPGVYGFIVWGLQNFRLLLVLLAAGYAVTLFIDAAFVRAGLAPRWWLRLQLTMKIAITAALVVAATI